MRIEDVTVEVRDVDLRRVGQIMPEHVDLRATLRDMAAGEWVCRLPLIPATRHLTDALLEPGGGLVITHVDPTVGVLWSGPGLPTEDAGQDNPAGTLTVNGTTDDVLLWNRQAYPLNGGLHTVTGTAEATMIAYVMANLGPTAGPGREVPGFTAALDLGRGGDVTRTAWYDRLGELLAGIAVPAGLSFRVVQVGDHLEFQVTDPQDRTGEVRLDLRNGTLASHSATVQPPTVTDVVVLGQGDRPNRTQVPVTTTAAAPWGPLFRVEQVLDQRNTDDPAALAQAGVKALLDAAGGASVSAVPSDDQTMAWPLKWDRGDDVAVIVSGTEYPARVTEVQVIMDADGVKVGAALGNLPTPDRYTALRRDADALASRLEALERLVAASTLTQ